MLDRVSTSSPYPNFCEPRQQLKRTTIVSLITGNQTRQSHQLPFHRPTRPRHSILDCHVSPFAATMTDQQPEFDGPMCVHHLSCVLFWCPLLASGHGWWHLYGAT